MGDWPGVIWKACCNTEDEEWAQHLFHVVASRPVGSWGAVIVMILGGLYGTALVLIVLLGETEARYRQVLNGGQAGALLLVVALSVGLVALFILSLPYRRMTWRRWLGALLPQWYSFYGLAYIPVIVLFLALVGLLFGGHGYDTPVFWIIIAVLLALLVEVLTLMGGGLLSGIAAGLFSGVTYLVVVATSTELSDLLTVWPLGVTGLLAAVLVGVPAGLLSTVLEARLTANRDVWRQRALWFWWKGRPHAAELEVALHQAVEEYPVARRYWAFPLSRLVKCKERLPSPDAPIEDLDSEDWVRRFVASHCPVATGGTAVEPLVALVRDDLCLHRTTARWLLESIAADTASRLESRVEELLCLHCLVRFGVLPIRVPGRGLSYYGCRACGQSRDSLEWPAQIVAVLDRDMQEEQVEQDGALRVNWLARRALFDFDRVEIVRAADQDVERFAVQVGNDTDFLLASVAATFAALTAASAAAAKVNGMRRRIASLFDEASEGLRASFPEEVRRARAWLERRDLPDSRQFGMTTGRDKFQRSRQLLENALSEGRRIQESLSVALHQRADALGRHMAARLAEVEGRFADAQEPLQLWCAQREVKALEQTLEQSRQVLREERYGDLRPLLQGVDEELARKVPWAEEQEEKHQKRLYLLKALRQACSELGFVEVEAPHYEKEGDRGSRIHHTVDTVDRGQISFALTMEGISSFSEISEEHCFEEFESISQYLEQEFGIQTRFHHPGEEPPPRLRHKGELDLPEDAGMEMTA